MDSVEKDELLNLVHSFLKEIHLMKTARCLEQETGEVSKNPTFSRYCILNNIQNWTSLFAEIIITLRCP